MAKARKKKRRFTSKAQVGYMFVNHPALAHKFAHRNIRDSGKKVWKRALPRKKGK